MLRRHLIASAAWAAAAWVRPAAASCTPLADVPMRVTGGRILLDVTVDGTPVPFMLDTGAERTLATPHLLQAAHLRWDDWVSSRLEGIGGTATYRHADLARMTLGPVALHRRNLADVRSLAVVPTLPQTVAGEAIGGLLGLDLLGAFDLDLDFPAARLRLWPPGSAARSVPGRWMPAIKPRMTLAIPLSAGSGVMVALLDTGADGLALTPQEAARLGLVPTGQITMRGLKGVPVEGGSLTVAPSLGPIGLGPVHATITPLPPGTGAIIGIAPFAAHRLVLGFAPPGLLLAAP